MIEDERTKTTPARGRRTRRVRAGSRAPDGQRIIHMSADELQELVRAVAEVAGPESQDEVLFRLGRRLGEVEAARQAGSGDERARIEAGFARMALLGLAEVELEGFQIDAQSRECLVSGHVRDLMELDLPRESGRPSGTVCGLTLGYLTGLAAGATGLDLVCSPLGCTQTCGACGCRFEIRPAHEMPAGGDGRRAPAGSARFFLGTLGRTLAQSDISLDDLIETTTDAVILLDDADVVRFWNRGAEVMFQWRRDEVVGRKAGCIVPADLLEGDELGWIQGVLRREEALCNYITRRVRKDGKVLWVSLTRNRLHDSRGRPVGSTAMIRDISEQRRTELELLRSRSLAMIGELSAKIAHEIKNPLAGIYAAVQLLGRDVADGDPRKQVFEDVGHEIRRLDETVQELLFFARPLPPRPRTTDLKGFVRDLLENLRRQPDVQRHELQVEVEDGLMVSLDPRLMGQAFTNLVLNAAQAMDGTPGTIRVAGARRAAGVVLEVSDTGPGIAPDALDSIFEPFFTTKSRGTGLGLAIARKNVEAHGGRIGAGPAGSGGAAFRIHLPAAEGGPVD